jgi:ectoine hydroxylase-related dioxygenase (phytanoyl-CoA dioxygenase family)
VASLKKRNFMSLIRAEPHLYSAITRARLFLSRKVFGLPYRIQLLRNAKLFELSESEAMYRDQLERDGYVVIPDFFDTELVDEIYRKADAAFHRLELNEKHSYAVRQGELSTLAGLEYEELARLEKMLSLKDPLIVAPESAELFFHESILKIVMSFLGYVAPNFSTEIVRDFPHDQPRESSNFHKDNDERDSVQVFVYLVDIDDTRGPLVYVPGSDKNDTRSCRPRLARDLQLEGFDGRIPDSEVERVYPRSEWKSVFARRGSVAIIHGNGLHRGPGWCVDGSVENRERTAIRININGLKIFRRRYAGNWLDRTTERSLTPLQRLVLGPHSVYDEADDK